MDERKRQIDELEKRKRDNTALLDGLLVRLGEGLFERIPDSLQETDSVPNELNDYRRLQSDIAGSEAAIEVIEEQIKKIKELDENIAVGERNEKTCSKELHGIYGDLGRLLLDTPAEGEGDFCAQYRSQADAFLTKAESLEDRLSGLEKKEGGNVFTWIGNSAQSLVLRSFLTKALENLESLRRNVGERYSLEAYISGGETGFGTAPTPEIGELCGEIEKKRSELKTITCDLVTFKEERRQLSDSFRSEGSPVKQIQSLKKHIAGVRDELKTLYLRVGTAAAGIEESPDGDGVKEDSSGLRHFIDSLVVPEDRETLDNAAKMDLSIKNDEKTIGRLRAALSIDEEQAKIEKYRRMILDKKEKIIQAEKNIADYEEGIADCEKYIEKLRELL